MKTPKYQRFHEKLSAYVAKNPSLLWLSEGESPVEVVKLSAEQVRDWKREENTVDADLIYQAANLAEGMPELVALFVDASKQEVKFVRPTSEQSQYDLYYLNRLGPWLVGVKVKVAWT